jgi:peptidoglycan hydrolase CwlO-like protein
MGKTGVLISFLVTWIIIIALVVVFAILGVNASNNITDNTNAINSLQTNIVSLQNSLNSANSNISALQTKLNSASSDISTLKTSLTSDESKISSLQANLGSAQSQLDDLTTELSSDESRITNLETGLAAANAQITSLQQQVNTLRASITGTQISGATTIATTGGQTQQVIAAFTANYTGTVTITGYSTSSTGYVYALNTTYGLSTNFAFVGSSTNPTTVSISVLPGNIYLYFGNTDPAGTIIYVYISSINYYH